MHIVLCTYRNMRCVNRLFKLVVMHITRCLSIYFRSLSPYSCHRIPTSRTTNVLANLFYQNKWCEIGRKKRKDVDETESCFFFPFFFISLKSLKHHFQMICLNKLLTISKDRKCLYLYT